MQFKVCVVYWHIVHERKRTEGCGLLGLRGMGEYNVTKIACTPCKRRSPLQSRSIVHRPCAMCRDFMVINITFLKSRRLCYIEGPQPTRVLEHTLCYWVTWPDTVTIFTGVYTPTGPQLLSWLRVRKAAVFIWLSVGQYCMLLVCADHVQSNACDVAHGTSCGR